MLEVILYYKTYLHPWLPDHIHVQGQALIRVALQLNRVVQVRGHSRGRICVEHIVVQHGTVLGTFCGQDLLLLGLTHATTALLGYFHGLGSDVLQCIGHDIEGQERLLFGLRCI